MTRCDAPGCEHRPYHAGTHGPVTNPTPDPQRTATALRAAHLAALTPSPASAGEHPERKPA